MKSYIRRIKLGVMITLLSLSVGRSQVSTAPHDMVWQVVASGSSLRSVYLIADRLRGWAVGEESFELQSDPLLPIWAIGIEAHTDKREWSVVDLATPEPTSSGKTRWRFQWNPADRDFRPGDKIERGSQSMPTQSPQYRIHSKALCSNRCGRAFGGSTKGRLSPPASH